MQIAFFTLNAYDMLTGGYEGDAVGGAQLQQILIGKELANRGHEVIFIEYDSKNKEEEIIDGIEIITKPRPSGSQPSRAFEATLGTIQTLRRVNPDVCYRRVLNFEILPISLYCNLTGTRFVYGIAHDDELTDNPHMFSKGLKSTSLYKILNRHALSSANAIVAQNSLQFELATRQLDTTVRQIPNCYLVRKVDPIDLNCEPPVVFWASRFQPWKHPEIVSQLAENLPDINFVMAGGPGDDELYKQVEKQAKMLSNLSLLGHVPFAEIDRYFAAADIFLNTSEKEGFPNTFLQAWAQETPVVSLQVDPDDILATQKIGVVANGSIKGLQDKIDALATDIERLEGLGRASREYLQNHHEVNVVTDHYEQVFLG